MTRVSLSPVASEALIILGASIRAARIRRGWTVEHLAERVGVSRPTMLKVEHGDRSVAAGTLFEAAWLAGVPLFSDSDEERTRYAALKSTELALLPATARPRRKVSDDF
jgi:transcriptional regulator with XRE-family HTH domain